jgi:capsule polysaccharide export protein KpsE/RkpR
MAERHNKAMAIGGTGYDGPERRGAVAEYCPHHAEHLRILNDHDRELGLLRASAESRRDASTKAHGELYEEIKMVERSRVPSRLFYVFVSVYSVLFILGIVSVYKGMHQNALVFQAGLSEVKVVQAEAKAEIAGISDSLHELKKDLNQQRAMGRP